MNITNNNPMLIQKRIYNHLMMSYLAYGDFKIALKLKYSFASGDDRIITTSIDRETIGACGLPKNICRMSLVSGMFGVVNPILKSQLYGIISR